MKINCCIAAAILAYCAAATPTFSNSTKPQPSPSLPSDPISLLISPIGIVKPITPTKFSNTSDHPGNLEDFPTISEDYTLQEHDKNGTHRPNHHHTGGHGPVIHPAPKNHKNGTLRNSHDLANKLHDLMTIKDHGKNGTTEPMFHPDGLGGPGPVMQPPRPTVQHNATTGKYHPHSVLDIFGAHKKGNLTAVAKTNKTTKASPEEEEPVIVFYISSRNDGKPGNCPSKALHPREIIHNHDQDHTIIDDCKINTAEKNYKEANAIISQAKTEISSVHSDKTSNSHKTIADASNELNGMVDLPPHLREFYLDQLAKLNATSANTFTDSSSSNTSLDTYTKSDPKDGTSSTDSQYHSVNVTTVNSHDELAIDGHVPIDLSSKTSSETHIQPKPTSLPSASSLISSTVATSSHTEVPSFVTSIRKPSTSEFASATSASESWISSSKHLLIPSSTTASTIRTSAPMNSTHIRGDVGDISTKHSSIPSSTTLLTITTSAPQNATQSKGHKLGEIFTRFGRPKSITTSPSPTSTKEIEAASTHSSPLPTSSFIDNGDDDEEVPNSDIVGSNGQELAPVQTQRRGQMAYVNEIQLLNKSHMERVVACKSNVTCISETNRNFALALGQLKYN